MTDDTTRTHRGKPRSGDLLVDTRTGMVGEYKGEVAFRDKLTREWWLRPIGGGYEWPVRPDQARLATDAETRAARRPAR